MHREGAVFFPHRRRKHALTQAYMPPAGSSWRSPMFLHTVVACSLAFAIGFASTNNRRAVSASDLIIPVAFSGATAWAVAIHASAVLYFGLSAAYASSALADSATVTASSTIRRLGKAAQALVPLAAFVFIWLLKPSYFEVGVAFTGAIWIKHTLFDQVGFAA